MRMIWPAPCIISLKHLIRPHHTPIREAVRSKAQTKLVLRQNHDHTTNPMPNVGVAVTGSKTLIRPLDLIGHLSLRKNGFDELSMTFNEVFLPIDNSRHVMKDLLSDLSLQPNGLELAQMCICGHHVTKMQV